MDFSDIFYFFFGSGRGKGESEAPGGGVDFFIEISGGGVLQEGEGPRGRGGVSAANWGMGGGG